MYELNKKNSNLIGAKTVKFSITIVYNIVLRSDTVYHNSKIVLLFCRVHRSFLFPSARARYYYISN